MKKLLVSFSMFLLILLCFALQSIKPHIVMQSGKLPRWIPGSPSGLQTKVNCTFTTSTILLLVGTMDGRALSIPSAGMRKTQRNVEVNNKIKPTLFSKEVLGYKNYQGSRFLIEGTAKYLTSGSQRHGLDRNQTLNFLKYFNKISIYIFMP